MRKETYTKILHEIYVEEHGGSHYTFDNEKFMNHGDLCEVHAKSVLGFEAVKDANTKCGEGFDIPELKASVKSYKCGLTQRKDMPKGDPIAFRRKFWKVEDAEIFIWVVDNDETVDLWFMNRREFGRFLTKFGYWDKWANNFRISTCSNTTNKWLESQIR